MRTIDEYLRYGVSTRRLRHGMPVSWVCLNIELFPLHSFFPEESLGPVAVRTPTRCVE